MQKTFDQSSRNVKLITSQKPRCAGLIPENSHLVKRKTQFASFRSRKEIKMSGALKRLVPLFDRVLIKKADAITKTKGGIVIPEKAAGKILHGTVVAVGPGQRKEDGSHIPITVQVGEKVLLPEYGGTKVDIAENEEYHLYRETDILAKVDS